MSLFVFALVVTSCIHQAAAIATSLVKAASVVLPPIGTVQRRVEPVYLHSSRDNELTPPSDFGPLWVDDVHVKFLFQSSLATRWDLQLLEGGLQGNGCLISLRAKLELTKLELSICLKE